MRIGFSISTNTFNVSFDYKLTCVYTVAHQGRREAGAQNVVSCSLSLNGRGLG
jgi:hypothetical protein